MEGQWIVVSLELQRLFGWLEITLELLDSRDYCQKFFLDGAVPFLVDTEFAGVVGYGVDNIIHVLEKYTSLGGVAGIGFQSKGFGETGSDEHVTLGQEIHELFEGNLAVISSCVLNGPIVSMWEGYDKSREVGTGSPAVSCHTQKAQ